MTDSALGDRRIPTVAEIEQTYGQLPTAKEIFYDWYGANTWLFKTINSIRDPSYDDFMRFATQIGDRHFFIPYLMVLLVCGVLTLIYRKLFRKGAVKQQFYMWIGTFLVLGASFVAYIIIVSWCKEFFAYARPYVLIEGTQLLELKEPSEAYRSFPSGHVAFISVIIFSLWPVISSPLQLFGLGIIGLVAWSRIALGVHFPADAFWGFLLGFAIVYVTRKIINSILSKLFGIHCDGA